MVLFIISIVCALLHWYSLIAKQRKIEYFAKPATMTFLILWFITSSPPGWSWFSILILLGLILSLAGDIFLMLPAKWFLAGLIAFLLAHIAYIGGLNLTPIVFDWRILLFLAAILACAIPIFKQLRRSLIMAGNARLVVPVLIYVIVISIMVISASTTNFKPDWSKQGSLLVTIGAVLFFISDALLSWNRFVSPLPQGRLISIIPYHLAQYFITFGALQQLGSL